MPRNTLESAPLMERAMFAVLETLEQRCLLSFSVPAQVETDPVHNTGDASDDMAFWVHPTDASRSLVIGTRLHQQHRRIAAL